ncbi:hypothetical protein ACFLZZ_00445 [Nanoarchaeota archaeon]
MVGTRPLGRGTSGIGTKIRNPSMNRSKNPKCPNCRKTLWIIQWGDGKGTLHCPQSKGGCGYKNIPA